MVWDVFDSLWGMEPWGGRPAWPGLMARGTRRIYPAVNVYGDDERLVLTSEIPGMVADDLEVTVHGRNLTLKGTRRTPELAEGEAFTVHERELGEFSRSLTLPYEVESEKVDALYTNGVLTLKLPRVERDKPRKITIKAH